LNHDAQTVPPCELKPADHSGKLRGFALATGLLILCFAIPLWQLIRFAAASELYSFILLIPFISFYLVWSKRQKLSPVSLVDGRMTAGFLTAGAMVLLVYWLVLRPRLKGMEDEYLAVMVIAFLFFFLGVCARFLGRPFLCANIFPLGFLLFMVPIPVLVVRGIDAFLQAGSAMVAGGFFTVAGTSYLQDGLVFQLPDITIKIAPECSGIHSSLILLVTSVLAAYFFLLTPWKRAVFILAVIPLGILRNGFRVFTIGELCVHVSPRMIDSPIHHKGGPIFFLLSLIPLFILLVVLQKSERRPVNINSEKPETIHA
jgi:exosortase C (VPDSG-CTERM-specific)